MELKQYQRQTLDVLRRYLAEARVIGPQAAFQAITAEEDVQQALRSYRRPYRALNGMEGVPYVCLRLPTGGGKTILAAHSVAVAREAFIEKDFPLVLWLAPTSTIRQQTVETLKNPRHPYRQVLDEAFSGRVRVFDIGDFMQITPHDLTGSCCVVVGTIQSLRVTNTEGRKVYAHNEDLEPHFSALPRRIDGLDTIEEGPGAGRVRFSFANLLHLHQPLMIVDEAHTAVTGLSREMQRRVNPSAIIEFSATPQRDSNLLYSVSAQTLKDEEMIKLPVVLSEHSSWQQAVDGALAKRAELEAVAATDQRYIRPLVLFQAQNQGQEATVAVLKDYLIEQGIAEHSIRIATGEQRELDNVNLFDPACEVDFIITVEALKEGWDCSFAYVFCSLANVQSATSAEQLLGRVLRMPYAERRKDVRLNKAYANLASPNFAQAARALRDRMVAMGFDEDEAEQNIEVDPRAQGDLDDGLFAARPRPKPAIEWAVTAPTEAIAAATAASPDKIAFIEKDGETRLRITGFLTPQEKEAVVYALPESQKARFHEEMAAYEAENAHRISSADKGETMFVPALLAWVQGELELADTDLLMEHCQWSLLDHSAQLLPGQFDVTQTANTFEIDFDGQHVTVTPGSSSAQQLMLDIEVEGWSEQGLVLFLARQVREADLSPSELIAWLARAVQFLLSDRHIPLAALMQCKYVLARKLKDRVAEIRKIERTKVYTGCLFGPERPPEVNYERGFTFKEGAFTSARKHTDRSWRFVRHFTGPDNVPAFDSEDDDGQEINCARALDALDTVKHWLRNVPKHPDAFWLPLAGGRFYPDFIAELVDGRIMVVEYKGEHLLDDPDTKEKHAVGVQWERAMAGKGLFLLARHNDGGRDARQQMVDKIGGR